MHSQHTRTCATVTHTHTHVHAVLALKIRFHIHRHGKEEAHREKNRILQTKSRNEAIKMLYIDLHSRGRRLKLTFHDISRLSLELHKRTYFRQTKKKETEKITLQLN